MKMNINPRYVNNYITHCTLVSFAILLAISIIIVMYIDASDIPKFTNVIKSAFSDVASIPLRVMNTIPYFGSKNMPQYKQKGNINVNPHKMKNNPPGSLSQGGVPYLPAPGTIGTVAGAVDPRTGYRYVEGTKQYYGINCSDNNCDLIQVPLQYNNPSNEVLRAQVDLVTPYNCTKYNYVTPPVIPPKK